MSGPDGGAVRRVIWALGLSAIANPWTKLFSLVLAIATWLYVQGDGGQVERVKAQIAWTRSDDLVATEALPTSAQITVRGTRAALKRAHQSPVRLVVDLGALGTGEHEVELDPEQAEGLPSSVERLAVTPATVRFALEKVATHSVRILPVLVGEVPGDYTVAGVVAEPQVVEVRGSTGAVSSLREVSTRPVDISGLTGRLEREVELDLPRGVELYGATSLRVIVDVVSRTERRRVDGLEVLLGADRGWRLEPERIAVILEGPADALREIRPGQIAPRVVDLPEGGEAGGQEIEIAYGADEGPRLEVVLQAAESVRVVSIEPLQVMARRE